MSTKRTDPTIYRIIFNNQGKIYELYAREVGQSAMPMFIEVGALIFSERSDILIDPSTEKLRSEFAGVERIFIPMHAVIRIDQVVEEGSNKILSEGGNVTPFPIFTQ